LSESLRTPRVLVVDDTEEMRRTIRRALNAGGYQVDVAGTIEEAEAKEPGGYDAVLVDAQLGGQSGIDLVEKLRSKDRAAAA
jgi:DNA-binding response OmpR family regulator